MSDQWKTCVIRMETTETDGCRARFWAKASSPDGHRTPANPTSLCAPCRSKPIGKRKGNSNAASRRTPNATARATTYRR